MLGTPCTDCCGILCWRSAKAVFATVSLASGCKRSLRGLSPGGCTLPDALPLHLGNLSQHGNNQLSYALADDTKATDMNLHTLGKQRPDGALHVNGIPTQPIHGVHMQRIALSDVVQQGAEGGPVRSQHSAADALVHELTVNAASLGQCSLLR